MNLFWGEFSSSGGQKKIEPHHEKSNILHVHLHGNREANQRLCFRYTDSTIPLFPKSEISSLYPASVAVQSGLCRTRSETRTFVFSRRGSNVFVSVVRCQFIAIRPAKNRSTC